MGSLFMLANLSMLGIALLVAFVLVGNLLAQNRQWLHEHMLPLGWLYVVCFWRPVLSFLIRAMR